MKRFLDHEMWCVRQGVGSTTSTAWSHVLVGEPCACELTFAAPPSGVMHLESEVTGVVGSGLGGVVVYHDIEVRSAAGEIVVAPGSGQPVRTQFEGADLPQGLAARLVCEGLRPGERYTARQVFRVSGGTAVVGERQLLADRG